MEAEERLWFLYTLIVIKYVCNSDVRNVALGTTTTHDNLT